MNFTLITSAISTTFTQSSSTICPKKEAATLCTSSVHTVSHRLFKPSEDRRIWKVSVCPETTHRFATRGRRKLRRHLAMYDENHYSSCSNKCQTVSAYCINRMFMKEGLTRLHIRDRHETLTFKTETRSRPSPAKIETRPRHWPHQLRWDGDEAFKFQDEIETFTGLEMWPRYWNARCH